MPLPEVPRGKNGATVNYDTLDIDTLDTTVRICHGCRCVGVYNVTKMASVEISRIAICSNMVCDAEYTAAYFYSPLDLTRQQRRER